MPNSNGFLIWNNFQDQTFTAKVAISPKNIGKMPQNSLKKIFWKINFIKMIYIFIRDQSIITNYLLLITVALSRILAFFPFVFSTTNTWFLGVDILVSFISPLRLPINSACSLPPSYIVKIPVSASIYISRSDFANINFKIYNEMSFDILHKCQRNQE